MEDWDDVFAYVRRFLGYALPIILFVWSIAVGDGTGLVLSLIALTMWLKIDDIETDLAALVIVHRDEIDRIAEERERDSE